MGGVIFRYQLLGGESLVPSIGGGEFLVPSTGGGEGGEFLAPSTGGGDFLVPNLGTGHIGNANAKVLLGQTVRCAVNPKPASESVSRPVAGLVYSGTISTTISSGWSAGLLPGRHPGRWMGGFCAIQVHVENYTMCPVENRPPGSKNKY